jgi:hypothetical protein
MCSLFTAGACVLVRSFGRCRPIRVFAVTSSFAMGCRASAGPGSRSSEATAGRSSISPPKSCERSSWRRRPRFEPYFELAFDFLMAAWETDRNSGKGTLDS